MAEIDLPEQLVQAQRAVNRAWAEVEAHRRDVDARRRRDAAAEGARPDEARPWSGPALPPWTDAENARHEELMAAVMAAADARQAALDAAGLGAGYTVVQALHVKAREMAEV